MIIATNHVQTSIRNYPGEELADDIFTYLKAPRGVPEEIEKFSAEIFRPLLEWSQRRSTYVAADVQEAFFELKDEIIDEVAAEERFSLKNGRLVIEAMSPRGKACFALFQLLSEGKLDRIRHCSRCRELFYGRSKRNKFCSKKCQEENYHSPEWRKKNRERNKKRQRKYRELYFGPKKRRK